MVAFLDLNCTTRVTPLHTRLDGGVGRRDSRGIGRTVGRGRGGTIGEGWGCGWGAIGECWGRGGGAIGVRGRAHWGRGGVPSGSGVGGVPSGGVGAIVASGGVGVGGGGGLQNRAGEQFSEERQHLVI